MAIGIRANNHQSCNNVGLTPLASVQNQEHIKWRETIFIQVPQILLLELERTKLLKHAITVQTEIDLFFNFAFLLLYVV